MLLTTLSAVALLAPSHAAARLAFPVKLRATLVKRTNSPNKLRSSLAKVGANSHSRRQALQKIAGVPLAVSLAMAKSSQAAPEDVQVYFGCGCFWHAQHEFVEFEKQVLGRQGSQLTSLAGYAGGKAVGESGRVCYHNLRQVADYGRLGHGEVVGMHIPSDNLKDFAKRYFDLFVEFRLPGVTIVDRADPQDKGPEYRSLLGLPGGVQSPLYPIIAEQAKTVLGDQWQLVEGKGNEPDTLLKRTIYVMDSDKFPFYRAEIYHQFHNDFQSPAYGKEYNNLKNILKDAGKISETGCPEGL